MINMPETPANSELLCQLPKVLRARDFHLYLEGGKRLTDLWLHGGRAILGHKPPGVLKEMKNAGERGLFSPLPHPAEKRFIKALEVFFPGRVFRIYPDEKSLYSALDKIGNPDFFLWRPFLETKAETPIIVPVLPWPLGPAVLVLEKGIETSFPPGEIIPPVLLAPATRALYNLAAEFKASPPGKKKIGRGKLRYTRIEKALKESIWSREGIYLRCKADAEDYAAMFKVFLEGGFLIPPSMAEPAILPGFMSQGEEEKLAELLNSSGKKISP